MSKQKSRVKVRCALALGFFVCFCLIGIQYPIIIGRPPQAMRVLIHTHLFCLLGTMPQTPLNAEFILRLRVLQTLLKCTPKCRPLCRGVTNRYTPIISRATVKQRGPPADEWAKRPMIEHFSSPHPMVLFRAEGVVNHDTFMYGVVRPEIGTTLKDGVAIYHPIGRYGARI